MGFTAIIKMFATATMKYYCLWVFAVLVMQHGHTLSKWLKLKSCTSFTGEGWQEPSVSWAISTIFSLK